MHGFVGVDVSFLLIRLNSNYVCIFSLYQFRLLIVSGSLSMILLTLLLVCFLLRFKTVEKFLGWLWVLVL